MSPKTVALFTILILTACTEDSPTPVQTQPPVVLVPDDSLPDTAIILAKGKFTSGATGTVVAYDDGTGNKALQFKNDFKVSGCSSFQVFLSKDLSITDAISLGNLQHMSGNQIYSITGYPDFTLYKDVVIWCPGDSGTHGNAELK